MASSGAESQNDCEKRGTSSVFFDPEFQDALEKAKEVAQKLKSALTAANSSELEAELNPLIEKAAKLENYEGAESRRVVLHGDAGVGSSSRISVVPWLV